MPLVSKGPSELTRQCGGVGGLGELWWRNEAEGGFLPPQYTRAGQGLCLCCTGFNPAATAEGEGQVNWCECRKATRCPRKARRDWGRRWALDWQPGVTGLSQ